MDSYIFLTFFDFFILEKECNATVKCGDVMHLFQLCLFASQTLRGFTAVDAHNQVLINMTPKELTTLLPMDDAD